MTRLGGIASSGDDRDMELEQELHKLREEVETWRRRNGGAYLRRDMRARLVEAARRAQVAGATTRAIAEHLGVKEDTLARWLRADKNVEKVEGMLREMNVLGEEPLPRVTKRPLFKKGPPRLLMPGGIVVEGLNLEQLLTVLRGLR